MSFLTLSKKVDLSNKIASHVQGFKTFESQLTNYPTEAYSAGAIGVHSHSLVESNPAFELMIATQYIAG